MVLWDWWTRRRAPRRADYAHDVGAAREMLPACLHDYVDSEALFRESD